MIKLLSLPLTFQTPPVEIHIFILRNHLALSVHHLFSWFCLHPGLRLMCTPTSLRQLLKTSGVLSIWAHSHNLPQWEFHKHRAYAYLKDYWVEQPENKNVDTEGRKKEESKTWLGFVIILKRQLLSYGNIACATHLEGQTSNYFKSGSENVLSSHKSEEHLGHLSILWHCHQPAHRDGPLTTLQGAKPSAHSDLWELDCIAEEDL